MPRRRLYRSTSTESALEASLRRHRGGFYSPSTLLVRFWAHPDVQVTPVVLLDTARAFRSSHPKVTRNCVRAIAIIAVMSVLPTQPSTTMASIVQYAVQHPGSIAAWVSVLAAVMSIAAMLYVLVVGAQLVRLIVSGKVELASRPRVANRVVPFPCLESPLWKATLAATDEYVQLHHEFEEHLPLGDRQLSCVGVELRRLRYHLQSMAVTSRKHAAAQAAAELAARDASTAYLGTSASMHGEALGDEFEQHRSAVQDLITSIRPALATAAINRALATAVELPSPRMTSERRSAFTLGSR